MVVISSERRGRPRQAEPGGREQVTVNKAINSQGQAVPPYIIVLGKVHLASQYRNTTLPADQVIDLSDNGWTNNKIGVRQAKHFDLHTRSRKKGGYQLLIFNSYESHYLMEFEEYCRLNNIITLCMPAHSSHRLQPFNLVLFSVLKRRYSEYIKGLIRRH